MSIYVFTAALSAFLLFLVQPLIGKSLLPWYGGSPLVWTTCMMFFQALLLGGYAYAHLLTTKIKPSIQLLIHAVVLSVGLGFAQILPDGDWAPGGLENPTTHLLTVLFAHVGFPFLALSATAPLLQSWFFRAYPERSPYPLYAVSNAGSLIAVLSYPFFFEPRWLLAQQETGWFYGYLMFWLGCISCGAIYWRKRFRSAPGPAPDILADPNSAAPATDANVGGVATEDESATFSALPLRPWLYWIGLSASGAVLLLATTDQISQDVASSPLFWSLPLCLYLLSFVLCFAKQSLYRRQIWLPLLPLAVVSVSVLLLFGFRWGLITQLSIYLCAMFVACMVCHGELGRARPAPVHLSGFYLAISVGGVLGGIFVGVIAPRLFTGLWEYSLGWIGLLTLILVRLKQEISALVFQLKSKWILPVLLISWFLAAGGFVADLAFDQQRVTVSKRSFFGRLAVARRPNQRCLFHGRIRHGCQWTDPERESEPTTYYGADSGVGLTVQTLRYPIVDGAAKPLRIGVIGLGVGTSAAWTLAQDTIRFYEIDPDVVQIAEQHFNYLKNAPSAVEIVVGDARLALAAETKSQNLPRFDILVLDAFTGNAIPLHLLTQEAFETYWQRLEPNGVLVAHISNRHVDLEPVLLGIAEEFGKQALLLHSRENKKLMFYSGTWVLLTKNKDFIKNLESEGYIKSWPEKFSRPIIFTDQRSNLLELLDNFNDSFFSIFYR